MSIRQTRLSPQCSQPENALSEGFRGNWEKKREGAVGKEEREVHARTRPILPLALLACLARTGLPTAGQ